MILVLAPEPPSTGWTAAGESLVKHAETRPDVIFPLICIVLAAGIPILFGFAVLRYWLPRWEAQAQLDRESREKQATLSREHTATLLAARGKDAADDAQAQRELFKERHDSIVNRVESKLDRVTGEISKIGDRLERHGDTLRNIATKVGIAVLLVLVTFGAGYAIKRQYAVISAPNCRCDPPCNAGMKCTCDGCREIKTSPASSGKDNLAKVPHSSIKSEGLATAERAYVSFSCDYTKEACL